jgi:hypothetical protein
MNRLALTFTIVPGSQQRVTEILSGYGRPAVAVDDQTRLLRTSVFLGGNRVVRAVDIAGDVGAALRHLTAQPQIQAVERQLNEYLEQPRDLADPAAARAFFARASLPRAGDPGPLPASDAQPANRCAVLCPVRAGNGGAVAELLVKRHGIAIDALPEPIVGSTVFHRDDVVVWMLEGDQPVETMLARTARAAADAESRAEGGACLADLLATDLELGTADGFGSFVNDHAMAQLTDRRAGASS